MDPDTKLKTTIRLPVDLHWTFQSERVRRKLSNENAIQEAFSLWINSPGKPHAKRKSRAVPSNEVTHEIELSALNSVRDILRSGDAARIALIRAVLDTLSTL
jgi:hypothetical protein